MSECKVNGELSIRRARILKSRDVEASCLLKLKRQISRDIFGNLRHELVQTDEEETKWKKS